MHADANFAGLQEIGDPRVGHWLRLRETCQHGGERDREKQPRHVRLQGVWCAPEANAARAMRVCVGFCHPETDRRNGAERLMAMSRPGTSRASGDVRLGSSKWAKADTTFSLARMCSRGNDNKAHGRLFGQSCAGRGTPPTKSAGTPLTRASILFARKSYEDDGLPGHKRVYARLRRAMPGNDDLNSAQCPGMTTRKRDNPHAAMARTVSHRADHQRLPQRL